MCKSDQGEGDGQEWTRVTGGAREVRREALGVASGRAMRRPEATPG